MGQASGSFSQACPPKMQPWLRFSVHGASRQRKTFCTCGCVGFILNSAMGFVCVGIILNYLGHFRSASRMCGCLARSHRCRPTAPCNSRCGCRTCLAMHLEMIALAIASSRQKVVHPTWSISMVAKSCRFTAIHRRSSPR